MTQYNSKAKDHTEAKLYKVLDFEGKPQSGGASDFRYSLPTADGPGEWIVMPAEQGIPEQCHRGLHLTYNPRQWYKASEGKADRVFEAEGGNGPCSPTREEAFRATDGKIAFQSVRLLREVTGDDLSALLADGMDFIGARGSAIPYRQSYRSSHRGARFPKDRAEAEATLKSARKVPVKLANNTYLEWDADGNPAVRLHRTQIVAFLPRGRVRLRSGGWESVTTKDRMLACWIPVGSEVGLWSIYRTSSADVRPPVLFSDGMEYSLKSGPSVRKFGDARKAGIEKKRRQARASRERRKEAAQRKKDRADGVHLPNCSARHVTSYGMHEGKYQALPATVRSTCACGVDLLAHPAPKGEGEVQS